ncbi:hypothetical protein [Chryseobacterium sp. ERMR1:04]|uniref:hypothetical protein n=1 Tax=Chryseobacterium sp. ERMR1:04 TaxID=1705393 RepID=UPI0006C87D2A|nr:hypothetical protein [Chryseobacterium sp. ERMR1:04]KPH15105.1 hypothetical protein AMQ68_06835 [Chryseobacterium sp. ERMR1:04]
MKKILSLGALAMILFTKAQVGIGTPTPNNSAMLDIQSSNKGFLPPRMSLLNETDGTTIPTPANGLLVFHTGTTLSGPGIYTNLGTPSSPKWSLLQAQNSNSGSTASKMSYKGEADPSKTVSAGNLEFRIRFQSGSVYLEARRKSAPAATIIYYSTVFNGSGNYTMTFTPANWNTWQTFDIAGGNGALQSQGFLIYISSLDDRLFYHVEMNSRYGNADASQKYWAFVVVLY